MTGREIVSDIYKIEVPFEDIYTAIFLVSVGERYLVIDSATTEWDVDGVILPAIRALGFTDAPAALLLSHPHGDHAGGARRLAEVFPGLPIYLSCEKRDLETRPLCDGDLFLGCVETVLLPGHTDSSCGFLDRRTGTLISCDCLQLRGVSKYTSGVKYPELYRASIDRLRGMAPSRILASHEYVPLGSVAEGKDAVARYLDECIRAAGLSDNLGPAFPKPQES